MLNTWMFFVRTAVWSASPVDDYAADYVYLEEELEVFREKLVKMQEYGKAMEQNLNLNYLVLWTNSDEQRYARGGAEKLLYDEFHDKRRLKAVPSGNNFAASLSVDSNTFKSTSFRASGNFNITPQMLLLVSWNSSRGD
ncbi:hypothetical protein DM02DRAFT_659419 [Periconia macrospinosa]|uniref:Uncharacterized protein n=1 Tax=Periconia macrospinosa TaxID=97972 RepID=A0A2V1DDJ8_9PLEO|nr:hypothetical protein DM02DRAFT_659419 [Periconia macrospinosa]